MKIDDLSGYELGLVAHILSESRERDLDEMLDYDPSDDTHRNQYAERAITATKLIDAVEEKAGQKFTQGMSVEQVRWYIESKPVRVSSDIDLNKITPERLRQAMGGDKLNEHAYYQFSFDEVDDMLLEFRQVGDRVLIRERQGEDTLTLYKSHDLEGGEWVENPYSNMDNDQNAVALAGIAKMEGREYELPQIEREPQEWGEKGRLDLPDSGIDFFGDQEFGDLVIAVLGDSPSLAIDPTNAGWLGSATAMQLTKGPGDTELSITESNPEWGDALVYRDGGEDYVDHMSSDIKENLNNYLVDLFSQSKNFERSQLFDQADQIIDKPIYGEQSQIGDQEITDAQLQAEVDRLTAKLDDLDFVSPEYQATAGLRSSFEDIRSSKEYSEALPKDRHPDLEFFQEAFAAIKDYGQWDYGIADVELSNGITLRGSYGSGRIFKDGETIVQFESMNSEGRGINHPIKVEGSISTELKQQIKLEIDGLGKSTGRDDSLPPGLLRGISR